MRFADGAIGTRQRSAGYDTSIILDGGNVRIRRSYHGFIILDADTLGNRQVLLMAVYYNEIDKFCCAWIRELIRMGMLPDGEIDNRSIADVSPDDLKGFTQCHFFAGIGGWAYALRLADWPDDREIWTGSCPCQPFSSAGMRQGVNDERHLWPEFYRLIRERRPITVIGEQVASKGARAWWDIVCNDLEKSGYSRGAINTCACSTGAPHIRQRLYWMAHSGGVRYGGRSERGGERNEQSVQAEGLRVPCELGESKCEGLERQYEYDRNTQGWQEQTRQDVYTGDVFGRMENTTIQRLGLDKKSERVGEKRKEWLQGLAYTDKSAGCSMPTNGFWGNPDWLWCRDKKWRPIESGIIPLVNGLSKGMVHGRDCRAIGQRLKGYGNAIVIPQAVEFIKCVMEVINADD